MRTKTIDARWKECEKYLHIHFRFSFSALASLSSCILICRKRPIGLFRYIKIQLDSESMRTKTKESGWRPIGLFRYIKIQLDSESMRTKTKESGWYVNIFHINSHVFLLSLSSLSHFQAEYLIYRKWPIVTPAYATCFMGYGIKMFSPVPRKYVTKRTRM